MTGAWHEKTTDFDLFEGDKVTRPPDQAVMQITGEIWRQFYIASGCALVWLGSVASERQDYFAPGFYSHFAVCRARPGMARA
ncbi:MAG: hypothetical protein LBU64_00915 [Planctomycetota bacterium]|jgi:hypothetical protein|nr:hypothetical protein [Planctomycetota bacterium]